MLFWKTQNSLESVYACVNGQSPLFPRISPGIRVMLVIEQCNRKYLMKSSMNKNWNKLYVGSLIPRVTLQLDKYLEILNLQTAVYVVKWFSSGQYRLNKVVDSITWARLNVFEYKCLRSFTFCWIGSESPFVVHKRSKNNFFFFSVNFNLRQYRCNSIIMKINGVQFRYTDFRHWEMSIFSISLFSPENPHLNSLDINCIAMRSPY